MSDRLQAATGGAVGPKASRFGRWIGGRARRREYWAWIVPLLVLEVLVTQFGMAAVLLLAIPRLLIWIRRLHDLGWSGWLAPVFNIGVNGITLAVMAFAGQTASQGIAGVILITGIVVLGCIPGEAKSNEYGPRPGKPSLDTDAFD